MRQGHFFLRREGVLGIGHRIVFLFHQRITFAISPSYAVNDLPEVHVKWSVILMAPLGPVIFSTLWMKGQFLHCERAHLKVAGWSLVSNEPLTKKSCPCFCNVWMKLVEVAKRQYQSLNGFGLIETFLRMIDLTAWLWGWNVRVNGMQSVFSFSAVFNADCRSICWARYEILDVWLMRRLI